MAVVQLINLVFVLAERKVSAFIQDRTGPMRVGPWGILQTLADGVKLLFKEDLIPPYGDRVLFRIAPYIIVCFSLAAFVAIPFGAIDLGDEQYSIGCKSQLKDTLRRLVVVGIGLFHYPSFPVGIDLGRLALLIVGPQCWASGLGRTRSYASPRGMVIEAYLP